MVIYNKAICMATVEEIVARSQPILYVKPGDNGYPSPANTAETAKKICDAARMYLADSDGDHLNHMNYVLAEGNGDGTSWRESAEGAPRLDQQMCWATLFFVSTHGENDRWRASHTDEITFTPYLTGEVLSYVTTKPDPAHPEDPRLPRTVPDYTFAAFYTCETLNNTLNNPSGFKLLINQLPQPDKGYVGTGAILHYQLYSPSNETLDEHAKKLLRHLLAGEPLEIALNNTEEADPDRKRAKSAATGGWLKLLIRGDPYTRLVNVYLSASEWAAAPQEVKDNWFWVIS